MIGTIKISEDKSRVDYILNIPLHYLERNESIKILYEETLKPDIKISTVLALMSNMASLIEKEVGMSRKLVESYN